MKNICKNKIVAEVPKIENNLIIIAIITLIVIVYFKNKEFSYSLVIASLFLFPVVVINSNRVSGSYAWLFILITIFLLDFLTDREKTTFSYGAIFYSFIASLLLLLSIFPWVFANIPNKIGLDSFIGSIKNLIAFIILALILGRLSKEKLRKVLFSGFLIAGVVNFVAVSLQIFYKNSAKLFYSLYWSTASTPLSLALQYGRFFRSYGTFSSPVTLGVVSLLVYSLSIAEYIFSKDSKWYWLIIIWFIVGISSLSKTFIVGSVFITLSAFILSIFVRGSRGTTRRSFIVLFSMFLMLIFGYALLQWKGFFAKYYYGYLLDPLAALHSRYSFSSNSILFSNTYKVIKEYPIFGVGLQSKFGEFIGDSSYVTILHNSGFVGLGISLLFILWMFFYIIKRGHKEKLIVLLSLLGVSLAIPVLFFGLYQIPFLLYLLKEEDVG